MISRTCRCGECIIRKKRTPILGPIYLRSYVKGVGGSIQSNVEDPATVARSTPPGPASSSTPAFPAGPARRPEPEEEDRHEKVADLEYVGGRPTRRLST